MTGINQRDPNQLQSHKKDLNIVASAKGSLQPTARRWLCGEDCIVLLSPCHFSKWHQLQILSTVSCTCPLKWWALHFFQLKIKIRLNCRDKTSSCTQISDEFCLSKMCKASLTAFHSLKMHLLIIIGNCDARITSVVAVWMESTSPFMDWNVWNSIALVKS